MVVADELDADRAVGPLFEVVDELQAAGALDQKVAFVEAGGAEFERVLGLAAEALLVGRVGGLGQAGQGDRPGQPSRRDQGRAPTVLLGEAKQVAPRYLFELLVEHGIPPVRCCRP